MSKLLIKFLFSLDEIFQMKRTLKKEENIIIHSHILQKLENATAIFIV